MDTIKYRHTDRGTPYELRTSYRQPTIWMQINRIRGNCWCGKPRDQFEKGRSKHCSGRCAAIFVDVNLPWNIYRYHEIHFNKASCVDCGCRDKSKLQIDHKHPLYMGGSMWDTNNHQILCDGCHKIKSKLDRMTFKRAEVEAKEILDDIELERFGTELKLYLEKHGCEGSKQHLIDSF